VRKKQPLLIVLCLFCCLLFALSFLLERKVSAEERSSAAYPLDVDKDGMQEYRLEAKGWITSVTPVVTSNTYEHAVYTHYHYKKNGRSFHLTFAQMENGSVLYFVRYTASSKAEPVQLQITALDTDINQTAWLTTGKEKGWKKTSQISDSFSSSLYIDANHLFYRIGKVDAHKPLGYTVYTEQPQAEAKVKHMKLRFGHLFSLTLSANANTESTTWGMLSAVPLIRWDNQQAAAKAALLEFEYDKKLREDGAYYLNETTYRPYEPYSFYRNPANGDGLRALSFLSGQENGVWFVNVASHLAYASLRTQTSEGYWETQPRSEWLHKEYNIGYRYMDNRRNADNATFLLRFNQAMPDPAIKQALRKWDMYLERYSTQHGMKVGQNGLFLPDYVGGAGSKQTHTSLNHQAANMNYLYEAFVYDGDEQKKQLADRLLEGIVATKNRWVKPDHNLYYALYPNLKPHAYPDYAYLTRDDLALSQYLLNKIYGEPSADLQFLIDSKNEWLRTR